MSVKAAGESETHGRVDVFVSLDWARLGVREVSGEGERLDGMESRASGGGKLSWTGCGN